MADLLIRADVPSALAVFLREQAMQVFAWGKRDCGLIMADWVIATGRADPAAEIRGRYNSAETCLQVCDAPDYQAAITGIADGAGLLRTQDPWDGDIGVVDIANVGPMGAIMASGSWAFRTSRGIAWSKAAPGRLLTAWEVVSHA